MLSSSRQPWLQQDQTFHHQSSFQQSPTFHHHHPSLQHFGFQDSTSSWSKQGSVANGLGGHSTAKAGASAESCKGEGWLNKKISGQFAQCRFCSSIASSRSIDHYHSTANEECRHWYQCRSTIRAETSAISADLWSNQTKDTDKVSFEETEPWIMSDYQVSNRQLGEASDADGLKENPVVLHSNSGLDREHVEALATGGSICDADAQGTFPESSWKGTSWQVDPAVDLPKSEAGVDSAVSTGSKFWQIVKNDFEYISHMAKWTREAALPFIAETAEKAFTMRIWEDHSELPVSETPQFAVSYSGLSGFDLLEADARTLKGYFINALAWLTSWKIPLEPHYDADKIAAYYSRRPHVVMFRVFQISAVFGLLIVQLEIEKAMRVSTMTTSNAETFARVRGAGLLKEALVKLGPSFIKVGQSLATRPDLVGSDVSKILSELQDSLAPFPSQQAFAIVEKELGKPLNEVFSFLSECPVAAASFGQVYKGRTIHGLDVAVKVQRPNLLHSIALDIYLLRIGLAALREIAKRRSDLKLYADELGQGLFGELDYTREAANAKEFEAAHSKLAFLGVPNVITALSTKRVLTMEWIDGDRPAELLQVAGGVTPNGESCSRSQQMEAKRRLFSLVNKGVEASLVQLLDTGLLHADPHPGNLLYKQDGKMIFLDFGLLCRMERHHQLAMVACVAHIVNADWRNFVQDLAEMEVLPSYINRKAIALELEDALGDAVPQEGIPDIKFSKVLSRVLTIALRHQFRMPPYFVLVLRSIASLEGLALAVDPDFKVFAASYPYVLQRLLTDNSAPLRKVLRSLVLNDKKQFRWDRLASFATLARQHTMKRVALETGMDLEDLNVPEFDVKNINPEIIRLLVDLLLSENGGVFRQLVIDADTYDVAYTFNSRKAASFRRQVATAIANVLYQFGKDYLKDHSLLTVQFTNPTEVPSTKLGIASDRALAAEMRSFTNSSVNLDFSLIQNRQLHFLFQTTLSRLKRRPLLLIKTGWTCLTMVCYALGIAAHKLIVAVTLGKVQAGPREEGSEQLVLA